MEPSDDGPRSSTAGARRAAGPLAGSTRLSRPEGLSLRQGWLDRHGRENDPDGVLGQPGGLGHLEVGHAGQLLVAHPLERIDVGFAVAAGGGLPIGTAMALGSLNGLVSRLDPLGAAQRAYRSLTGGSAGTAPEPVPMTDIAPGDFKSSSTADRQPTSDG
mgnify:CR=1 FL=1